MRSSKGLLYALWMFGQLAIGGALFFEVVRGDASPWAWVELNRRAAEGAAGMAVGILWYAACYSLGFAVPYWLISFVAFLRRQKATGNFAPPLMPPQHRRAVVLLSLGFQVLFLLFFKSVIGFFRATPTHEWNGWLLILGLALAGLLMVAAYGSLDV